MSLFNNRSHSCDDHNYCNYTVLASMRKLMRLRIKLQKLHYLHYILVWIIISIKLNEMLIDAFVDIFCFCPCGPFEASFDEITFGWRPLREERQPIRVKKYPRNAPINISFSFIESRYSDRDVMKICNFQSFSDITLTHFVHLMSTIIKTQTCSVLCLWLNF